MSLYIKNLAQRFFSLDIVNNIICNTETNALVKKISAEDIFYVTALLS